MDLTRPSTLQHPVGGYERSFKPDARSASLAAPSANPLFPQPVANNAAPSPQRSHIRSFQPAPRVENPPRARPVANAVVNNPPPRANANQEVSSDFQSMIFTWRVWLGAHLTALVAMMSANSYALAIDVEPCDTGIWTFTVFNTVVMGVQIGLSTLLMFSLPLLKDEADLRMTWRVHQQ
ncbi:hypothetical protein HDU81_001701 [Chytriomyces hyalinus]|nr:hypothetical protein HDU81_001701 [Chytriomyces hyalinus]